MNDKVGPKSDEPFEPRNELEFLIQSGRDNKVSLGTIFQAALRSTLWMVTNRELKEGDPLTNVQSLMVKDEDGNSMLTVFTGTERCKHFIGHHEGYDYPTPFPGPLLLDNMNEEMGLVINPGLPVGIQITADGIRSLKREVGRGWLKHIPADSPAEQGGSA